MNSSIQIKTTIAPLLLSALLTCFGLVSNTRATDTDGALPFGNNADGIGVLTSLTTGAWNSGFGFEALNQDTTGSLNTATGLRVLFNNTEGNANTASGAMALFSNTTGANNVAVGAQALVFNDTGASNTAVGTQALSSQTFADDNTAIGYQALFSDTAGSANTATGANALYGNTSGSNNAANGFLALFANTHGGENTANGAQTLISNTIGNENTASGFHALGSNTEGNRNTAVGHSALFGNTTGSNNTALGDFAGHSLTIGDNNIDIDNLGVPGESNTIRIGDSQTKAFIAGIHGVTTGIPNAVPVLIDSAGQLGTASSSRRFKNEIKPMDKASEAILGLKPVMFHYKSDVAATPQFGLIAEEVAEVNPDLVVRDENGEIYTVRYEAVNAMLLNEFLKEHKKVEAQNCRIQEQETTITQLKKEMKTVVARLKEQDSKIQKVSDQIELSKATTQVVNNR
jgi:hypothetical protein